MTCRFHPPHVPSFKSDHEYFQGLCCFLPSEGLEKPLMPFVTGRLSEIEFRELRWFCHMTLNIGVSCFRVLAKKNFLNIFSQQYRLKLGNFQQVYFKASHNRVVTKLPCFTRFWSNFVKVRFVCGLVTILWPLYAHPPPPPPRHDKLASKKHRDRNITLYKDIVSSLMSIFCVRLTGRARFMDSRVLGEQRQVCCPCARSPVWLESKIRKGWAKGSFWAHWAEANALWIKMLSTTESVQCKSLSNQKGTWRNINIAIVNVQADLNVLFSGHSQRRSSKGLMDNTSIVIVLFNS